MAGIRRVDHIAIAVRSKDAARPLFERLYGASFLVQKHNPEAKYNVAYFQVGDDIFTLLEGTEPDSFVAKHVEQRGEGVQHMGVEVDDLDEFLAHLEAQGARVSNRVTIDGIRKEALISPRSAFGIILQPIEWLGELKAMPPAERMRRVGGA